MASAPLRTTQPSLLCRYGGGHGNPGVALTFDDGPGPYTGQIASELDRLGARGTFFVVGAQVRGREHDLRRLVDAGHEIGNHSFDHGRDVCTSPREAYAQIRRTNAVVEAAAGARPRLFRPPWGRARLGVLLTARLAGMTPVLWNLDPRDWDAAGAADIEQGVLGTVRGGYIVVLHDGGRRREATVAALPGIVRGIRAAGYVLVTVSELLTPPR
jgi:peptidoglycan-N-acetylglucosamine deacetylase